MFQPNCYIILWFSVCQQINRTHVFAVASFGSNNKRHFRLQKAFKHAEAFGANPTSYQWKDNSDSTLKKKPILSAQSNDHIPETQQSHRTPQPEPLTKSVDDTPKRQLYLKCCAATKKDSQNPHFKGNWTFLMVVSSQGTTGTTFTRFERTHETAKTSLVNTTFYFTVG